MPQGPLVVASVQPGGISNKFNVTAAGVVKATPGTLYRIVVQAPGTTSGSLVLNDCATTGAAAASNQIISLLYSAMSIGQIFELEWPCLVGIVVSAVPTAGSPIYTLSYS